MALWVPLRAQAFVIPVTSETIARGTSDGFANQQVADALVNVKTEIGTSLTTTVTLLPDADAAGGWSQAPCQTDATFFDELSEDPADDDTTCRKEVLATTGETLMSTAMQNITPPGPVDDYDVTATGRVRLESGDDGGPSVTLASTADVCGGLVGQTNSSAYVDLTTFFERCSAASEWTQADIDGLVIESRCPQVAGIPEECRATQHKAVVDIAYRTDFAVDFTSHFATVFGVGLAVRWNCTTSDEEGLDLWVDGALAATDVCLGTQVGSAPIPDIGVPRAVDVRLVSRAQSGDVTESMYTFDLLSIEGSLNASPTANAGPDQSVVKGTFVQLDGSASFDPDGQTLTFSWTQAGGPAIVLAGPTTATPSFTPDLPGTYAFELSVSDGFGGSDADVVVVTATNGGPTANAGPNQAVARNVLVTLNGSGSSDPENDTLSFAWTQVSGPTVALTGAATAIATFPPLSAGTYTFRLEVDDGFGGRASDFVVVLVTNGVPTADAGLDQVVSKGTVVTLDGNASSDPDLDSLSFLWTQVSGPAVTLSGDNTSMATFTPPTPGVYTFRLSVDDGFGGRAEDIVVVTATNGGPTANAGSDQAVARNVLVTLNGSASSDPDLDALSFQWAQVSGVPAVLAGATTSTATFTPALPGTYVFELAVSDGFGGGDADVVVVTATNGNPVANAGPDQVVPAGILVTLSGSGSSDPDFDILSFRWTQVSGPAVVLSGAATAVATFTPLTSGMYTFRLEVDDGFGARANDFVVVTTSTANGVPTADAGLDQVVNKKTLVTLDGRNSIDPDFDVLTFQWAQLSGPPVALAGATAAMATFTPPRAGTFTFSLWVDDGFGGQDVDFVVVTALNAAPTANAGPNRSGPKNAAITLDGTGSSDPDVDGLGFLWTQTSGPVVLLSNPTGASPSFTPSTVGTYAFLLIVDDGDGGMSTDAVVVLVWGRTPTAVVTASPPIARVGVTFTFNSTGSTDPDGTIVALAFDFGDGASVRGATPSAGHAYGAAGAFTVTLTVTDNDGNTSTAQTSVTVTGNAAPVADVRLWTPSVGVIGTRFGFAGGNSTDDIGVVRFDWNFGDGTGGTGAALFHAFTAKGAFTVRLTATDGDGLTNATTVVVTINNRLPTIASQTPTGAITASLVDRTVTFAVEASDPDADALTYTWRVGGVVAGSDSPFYAFSSTRAGTYIVNVTVSDRTGQVVARWTVSVTAPGPSAEPGTLAAYLPEIILVVIIVGLIALLIRSRGRGPRTPPEERTTKPSAQGGEEDAESETDDDQLQENLDELAAANEDEAEKADVDDLDDDLDL